MTSRTNQRVLLGCALLCAAALVCADSWRLSAAESQPQPSVAVANFPTASAARLAGDGKQTRFILDIDQAVTFRAVTLADPYRVVVDVPQVNFQLPAGTGVEGRGLVKAFRYGLVMPGGSRIVFDLTGPAKIAKSYLLEAANGQPARLVLVSWRRSTGPPSCSRSSPRSAPNCGPQSPTRRRQRFRPPQLRKPGSKRSTAARSS
ncbi:hypothetical protein ACVWZR_009125 [Bradyrhizobium sp. i1.3.1]